MERRKYQTYHERVALQAYMYTKIYLHIKKIIMVHCFIFTEVEHIYCMLAG